MNIINERKSDEEESKLFEILQRIPGELQKTGENRFGSLELWFKCGSDWSMGMLRGIEGEWLKMASEQRTDYGISV